VPRYHCRGAALNHGADFCISFDEVARRRGAAGRSSRFLLQVRSRPRSKSATDAAGKHDELERAIVELEQAEYEAECARRQFDAVEPENRLVAATLESRWDAALRSVNELRSRLEALRGEQTAAPA
jgi:hypothetical protein